MRVQPTTDAINRATFKFWGQQPLTYKGVPIVYNAHCSQHTVYFLNRDGVYQWHGSEAAVRQLFQDYQ